MSKGVLIVNVRLQDEIEDINNIHLLLVRASNAEKYFEEYFDIDKVGKKFRVELYAPPKELSYDPKYTGRPYELYNLYLDGEKIINVTIKGIQIYSEITSIQNIEVRKALPNHENDSLIIVIPENPLVRSRLNIIKGYMIRLMKKLLK